MNTVYHTDGYCCRNGSPDAYGGFTVFKNGELLETRRLEKTGVTSNECELAGLLFAAEAAEEGSEIVTDSNVVIFWTRSGKPKARMDLQPWALRVKELVREKKLDVYWAPREENQAGIYNEESYGL